ncbi:MULTISPECIES: DUF2957 domain-containing protein [Burkholderia]|uniref:Lipoprotein n=2 Tax=Burkholderia TaxID=32008 RepID=A0AAW3Q1X5_9BURK|nr:MULTISPECIES: DUF2957 domain-containing protein [Burkholderia]MEB2503008.1 DUF2957 domain-containing protein [Burkholderia anthinoferrum]MEB2532065.1 DUF2957 domain-containing protein [Burkholderia anthinoferrum]MEB2564439.1 DUF2957 domain-containing protein [Burkholderia anthinoferrum]MEB2582860.1 DUF2957 domain-containing protein [Burkholderia anthinoferrum]KVH06457.1 hypothetical protein WS84_24470 [Burkholderia anthina]
MSHTLSKGVATAFAIAPFLVACGGGDSGGALAPIDAPQCSGSSCGPQGQPPSQPINGALCPANADIVKSTYLGGAGSGEIVSVNIDAVAMTYTLKWLESPIPLKTGTVTPSRVGTTITGKVVHPPTGTLPTAEQTRCAFVLTPGTGPAPDGSTYSTAADFNQANPPMLLVGMGVAGGGIPGATIQYDGLTIIPGVVQNVGQVPNRHFDFYPFLGFANTTTDLSKLPGTYNALLYHLVPSGNYATKGSNSSETFDANGACTSSGAGGCQTTGDPWKASANGGYFDSAKAPQTLPQTQLPIVGATGKSATAHMVIGQLNGATVPVIVRTGNVNLGTPPLHLDAQVDDESGIAVLGAATAITSGAIDGGYAGADSNFKYTAALIRGGNASFINPSTQAEEDGFTLDYGQTTPGLLNAKTAPPSGASYPSASGVVIATGGLYAALIQGTVNGGVTATSANSTTSSTPYFGVGAQISK